MADSNADEQPSVSFTERGVCHYANWRNISVGTWVGRATLEAVRGLFPVGGQMTRRFPLGHSSLVFVADNLPAPPPDVEELLKRSFGLGSDLACMAVVLEGTGFWASALRSLIANMHRAGRGNVRLQVATSFDDVIEWFLGEHARLTGTCLEVEAFRRAMRKMRADGAAAALPART